MGEEWTEDQFLKLSLIVAQGFTSKSYLAGMQQFVDLFGGKPGQASRIIAGIMNNQIPLGGLRNELGKLFTPYTRELNSGIADALRNRNLAFEKFPGEDLPIKWDILSPNTPIKEWDPITRFFNAVFPVQFNLNYSEGRDFLFRSGYDMMTSTMYSPGANGINLRDSPDIRSMFQKAIGNQNLEKDLAILSRDPKAIASIVEMEKDIRDGNRDKYEAMDYYHNLKIAQLFDRARKKAWNEIKGEDLVLDLSATQLGKKLERKKKTTKTSELTPIYRIYK